jgi:dihydrofolate synthase / folylpolyglutamate synthase
VIPVSPAAVQSGIAGVEWPGRLQLVTLASGRRIVLDGAHNVNGAQALAASLKDLFPNQPLTLILGILSDKDWGGMFRVLAPLAARNILVSVQNERTTKPAELAATCQSFNPAAELVCCASLKEALAETNADALVVIAGSLYLVGEAMELLKLVPAATRDERRLNEWSGSSPKQA